MFRISVRDNSDAAPEVSAVIMLPCMAALQDQITEKDGKEVKLEIDLEGKTAVLRGSEAIRAMIAEGKMGMTSEVGMSRTQVMVIAVEREKEVTEDGVTYSYKYKGRKLTIKGSGDANLEMMMVVTARDSKNVAEETLALSVI